MKKMAFALLVIFFSLSIKAQQLTCLDKLLPVSRHSGLHQLSREEWNDGKDGLDSTNVVAAFNSLTGGKLFCRPGEIQIKVQPICQLVITDIPQSNVCYLHTDLGYFVVSRDNGKTVNFIFSKDKTYANPTE